MRFLGLDGYRKGWVAVTIDDANQYIDYPRSFSEALCIPHDRAMVDMPIGIPQTGHRSCDLQGKKLLSRASSRLFTGARRALFEFTNPVDANLWAQANNEKGVSRQLFGILPKIKEVDALMSRERQITVMETHPELVFARLNSGQPLLDNKKSQSGIDQRIELLVSSGFRDIHRWLGERPPYVKSDDLLDACACAVAARQPSGRIHKHPEADQKGLRMEIWF